MSVPDDFHRGSGKLARSLRVVKGLSRSEEEEAHAKILDDLFDEVLRRKKEAFEPPSSAYKQMDSLAMSLKRALKADGYDIVDGIIVPLDKLEPELAVETSVLMTRLKHQRMDDVANTLDQAHQCFIEGRFEACNAMLRTSLEGTLKHIAVRKAGSLAAIGGRNQAHGPMPPDIREYLRQQGFLEQDEFEFVKSFYGYASTDGSHPGLSNESESRLRRLMIVALIQYFLEKLESQKW